MRTAGVIASTAIAVIGAGAPAFIAAAANQVRFDVAPERVLILPN